MYTAAVEDYLKVVYELIREHGKASTTGIAERLGIAPASVSGMLRKLAELHLVEHVPYQGVVLSPAGERIALEVIRHHRLIELYLAEALGIPWDQVHDEAHRLEHAVSRAVAERMAEALGHPTADPHGAPIPTREGTIAAVAKRRLTELPAGETGIVAEVVDENADHLRDLANRGVFPNVALEVVAGSRGAGPVTVRIGESEHTLPHSLAESVFINDPPN